MPSKNLEYPWSDGEDALGGSQQSFAKQYFSQIKEDYSVLKRNNVGGLWALIWKNLSK